MTIEVFDSSGKAVAKQRAAEGTTTIDTKLKAGDVALVKTGKKTVKVSMR